MIPLLDKLNIQDVNSGGCTGQDNWITDPNGKELISYNPTTGEAIASVVQVTNIAYQDIASKAHEAFLTWRELPAPKRGQVVRELGDALREFKEPLGDLVTLEMGKIRAEGHGEVQEMIDI
ncbi:MAG: aldehyde dehydrogenase family protein, partial [Anaerolineales bacterium]|nr:aldehyde dehydrogenase family protein [Anaerolineales bacterium]